MSLEIREITNHNLCCLTPMCCEETCSETARYFLKYSIKDLTLIVVLCKDHAEELLELDIAEVRRNVENLTGVNYGLKDRGMRIADCCAECEKTFEEFEKAFKVSFNKLNYASYFSNISQ